MRNESEWLRWKIENNPSIQEQIEKWIYLIGDSEPNEVSDFLKRRGVSDSGIDVLLRYQTESLAEGERNCFIIATVRLPIAIQGKGWFKSFLTYCCEVNPWESVMLEDVGNKKLQAFCRKMGFKVPNSFFNTTYLVNEERVSELGSAALKQFGEYV